MILVPNREGTPAGIGEWLFGSKKHFGRAVFLAAALIIFLVYRFEAHLYGDGYNRISDFAQRAVPVIPWYEFGSTFIPYLFYRIMQMAGQEAIAAAIWGYQTASFISGLIYILVVLEISELISDSAEGRIAFSFLTIFSGLSLLFFGMVTSAALLLPVSAGLVYFMIKVHQGKSRKYLYCLWGAQILGLIMSVQFLAALPAVIFMSIAYTMNSKAAVKWAAAASAVSIIAGLAGLYIWAGNDIAVANRILLLSGKMPDAGYSLFSGRHLMDLANLLFLFLPLWLILIYAIVRRALSGNWNNLMGSFVFLAGAQIILLFLIDPKNGMARDINLFAFPLTGLLLAGGHIIVSGDINRPGHIKRYGLRLGLAGLMMATPTFIVHLTPAKTVSYLDSYLAYNETKLEPALLAFRDYYFSAGNYPEADRREQEINGKVQDALQSRLVNDLFYHKRVDEAFNYASQLLEHNPYNATYRMQLGNLLKYYKKYSEAERELKTALKLDPYRPELYHFLADFYRETKDAEKSYRVIEDGLSVDPKNSPLLTDLAYYYYQRSEYGKTDSLCNIMIAADTAAYYAFLYKGLVAEHNGAYQQALDYYARFTKNDHLPEYAVILKRMNSITQMLSDSTGKK